MQNGCDFITAGAPRFPDGELARCAQAQGPLAAWRLALALGPKAAAGVGGDFAVAFRDASGRTFMAVDRFAIHSLCYRVVGGEIRFSGRADELAEPGEAIDPQAVYDYLYFHSIPSPRTIHRGVLRLPPGHFALFDRGQLTVAPYWQPDFVETGSASFASLRDEFMNLMRQAVRRQLDGSRPACFLSGGTDSSTVAGLIGEVSGQPAATYSIGFEAAGYDEVAYARIAAQRFGTEHHEYYVTPDDLVQAIPKVACHYDQPFGNSSALPAFLCQVKARSDGITTLLAGDGGDELFGGNTRYAKQKVFGWYRRLPAFSRTLLLEPALCRTPLGRLPLLRKGRSYIEQASVPLPDRLQMYNQLRRLGPEHVLCDGFLANVDVESPARQQRMVWNGIGDASELNRMLAFDWRYTLAENDLPKVCGTADLAGMRVAFPLLDDDLVAFSTRLRTSDKLRGLSLRWFFKEALRGFLPDEIISKRKHGFGLPFGVWVVNHPPLRRLATDALQSLATRGIIRSDFIGELLDTHLAAHPAYYGEMVWVLMMLELWLQGRAGTRQLTRVTQRPADAR